MSHPDKYIQCECCGNHYEWIYNDSCTQCNHDTEANLQAYYTYRNNIDKQHEGFDEAQDELSPFSQALEDHLCNPKELDDAQGEYEEQLYKLYSM